MKEMIGCQYCPEKIKNISLDYITTENTSISLADFSRESRRLAVDQINNISLGIRAKSDPAWEVKQEVMSPVMTLALMAWYVYEVTRPWNNWSFLLVCRYYRKCMGNIFGFLLNYLCFCNHICWFGILLGVCVFILFVDVKKIGGYFCVVLV